MSRPYRDYLDAPPSYWDYPEEIKKLICNGAGPEGIAWIVPDTLWGLSITEAANIHDWMYVWGETHADKVKADDIFLLNMMRLINEGTTKVPVLGYILRALRHRRAVTYYEAVCELGGRAYRDARYARPAAYADNTIPESHKEIYRAQRPCKRPPPGWRCTRGAGHSGPCAAVPDEA